MNKPVKYWVRRVLVSLPFYFFLVHEADTRRRADGTRVFGDHHGAIMWAMIFALLWLSLDLHIKYNKETDQ
jgi:hypothetical protein